MPADPQALHEPRSTATSLALVCTACRAPRRPTVTHSKELPSRQMNEYTFRSSAPFVPEITRFPNDVTQLSRMPAKHAPIIDPFRQHTNNGGRVCEQQRPRRNAATTNSKSNNTAAAKHQKPQGARARISRSAMRRSFNCAIYGQRTTSSLRPPRAKQPGPARPQNRGARKVRGSLHRHLGRCCWHELIALYSPQQPSRDGAYPYNKKRNASLWGLRRQHPIHSLKASLRSPPASSISSSRTVSFVPCRIVNS